MTAQHEPPNVGHVEALIEQIPEALERLIPRQALVGEGRYGLVPQILDERGGARVG